MGEDFLLKWNDHHSLFFKGAEELCASEEYTDVTLSAGTKFFSAHKMVLSICSTYFRQLFRHLGPSVSKSVVHLKDVEPRHLELLLHYMYKGEIRVQEEELVPVLNTAQGLEIKGLSENLPHPTSGHTKPPASQPTDRLLPTPPPLATTGFEARKRQKTISDDVHTKAGVTARTASPLTSVVKQEVSPVTIELDQDTNHTTEFGDYEGHEVTDYVGEVEEYDGGDYYNQQGDTDDRLEEVREGGGQVIWRCKVCGKKSGVKSNLKKHMVVHTGVKKYFCRFCHMPFGYC